MPDTLTAPAAPAAPVAPAPAAAPVVITSDDGSGVPRTIPIPEPHRNLSDTVAALARKTGVDAPAAPTDVPQVRFQRDATTPDAPATPDAPPGEAVEAVDTTAPTVSEAGDITLSDDDADVTLSAQRNADGTFKTKLDPSEKLDFTIRDKATGEVKAYSKTLPEVVRLAKDGVSLQTKLQEVQPEVEYYRANVSKWQQQVEADRAQRADLETQLQQQMDLNRLLLSADDAVVAQHREQYQQEMTPEKQLERLRAERAAEIAARETEARTKAQAEHRQRVAAAAQTFANERLAGAIAKAETVLGKEAVVGAVHLFTSHLLVDGMYPPNKWNELAAIVNAPNGPFQTWVAAETAKRGQQDSQAAEARQRLDAERKRAQQVVNDAGRSMTPIGRGAIDTSAPQKPPAKNKQEVLQRMIHAPLPTTG
jgi:hypothetical protein